MRHTQLPDLQTEWTEADARLVFDEWHRSGTSIAAFAREHGVSAARLYWWKRRLSKRVARSSMMSLVPATVIPVAGSALVIRLPNGVAMEIASTSASPSWIAEIVTELMRSSS